ncbi:hypothetical protein [Reinekea sp.]|uniref:hypothetical protein n=1 Tax=Reinekea sp. TaxID=1970455 RepID=UPI002A80A6CF|nr:hypothetical protein [Reinekea sp.]
MHTEPLTRGFSAITLFGKSYVIVLFVSALAILLVLWRKGVDLMALVIVIVGDIIWTILSGYYLDYYLDRHCKGRCKQHQ